MKLLLFALIAIALAGCASVPADAPIRQWPDDEDEPVDFLYN